MFIKGLYMLLTADPGVSAIVGSRVYFILQPKMTLVPSLVLSCVSTSDLYTMSGITGFREGQWQIDCYASDYYSASGLQLAVRSLLENYVGNLPDTDATAVTATFIEKAWDMPYEQGGKNFIYRSLLGVRFHYYDTSLPVSTPSNPEAVIDGGTS
jgi:Protein of unknown function (DUF3168)